MQVTRVYIVDDHPVVQRGLGDLFDREEDFVVCGISSGVTEAMDAIPKVKPDLVISDLSLGDHRGLDLVSQLVSHDPSIPVLIVSMHDEELYANRALAAGARGYVMKEESEVGILEAAREVAAGGIYLSEKMRSQIRSEETSNTSHVFPLDVLTDRELEVYRLIGQGFAPRHIAEKLNLSVSTIEAYRERIKSKLGLASSPQLLRHAVRWCKDHDV